MKKIIYVTIAIAAIFSSCKKDDNTSASPKKKITRADLYQENGYISGKIVGESSLGVPFEKPFIHQLDSQIATYDYVGGFAPFYIIHLNKLDKYGRIGENEKKTDMIIILNKNKVAVRRVINFHTSIYIDSSATTITKFNINSNKVDDITSAVFSNVLLNTTDGKFTCDYIMNVPGTSTSSNKPATITGKISTTLTNILYRTGSSL